MKTLSLASFVLAAALSASFAGAQVTVNGKPPKGVKITKVKDGKTSMTTTKKKRHKFLGIF